MKRILALIGAALLLAMYIATFVFALMKSPASDDWFRASVLATLIIPTVLYCYQLIFKHAKDRDKSINSPFEEDGKTKK